MAIAKFCKRCGRGYVNVHECPNVVTLGKLLEAKRMLDDHPIPMREVSDGHEISTVTVNEPIPEAWQAVAKIFTQELCEDECEWCQDTPDPYNTGDYGYVQSECTVPTPRQCPAFEDYIKEHS